MKPIHPFAIPEVSPDYYARLFADRIGQVRRAAPEGNHHRRAIALIVFLVSVVVAVIQAGQAGRDAAARRQELPEMQEHLHEAAEPAPDAATR
jgi:hypothetical protein